MRFKSISVPNLFFAEIGRISALGNKECHLSLIHICFAVVGRPNAGKSSIINAFIGEDRNIVTEIAGTTRDLSLIHISRSSA